MWKLTNEDMIKRNSIKDMHIASRNVDAHTRLKTAHP